MRLSELSGTMNADGRAEFGQKRPMAPMSTNQVPLRCGTFAAQELARTSYGPKAAAMVAASMASCDIRRNGGLPLSSLLSVCEFSRGRRDDRMCRECGQAISESAGRT